MRERSVCSNCGAVLDVEEETIQECYDHFKPGLYQEATLGTLEGDKKQGDDSKIANVCVKLQLDSSIGSVILARYNEYKKHIRNRAKAITFAVYYALIKHGIFRREEEVNEAVQMQFNTKTFISIKEFADNRLSRTELERYKIVNSGNKIELFDNNTASKILEAIT
ncbi:MAG: hypothetical protein KatS3mg003_0743 [Candidatus Nitrosocaldaceae archaeon]|nr:MAG: hypothetical protein KatS3mg003_0743 [Candidatus Nitrosocaldaceae archaeon]